MDEAKVAAVTGWPTPMPVKDLQCFLGFANFYLRYIQGFSTIASLLTTLLMKGPKCLARNPEVGSNSATNTWLLAGCR